MRIGFFQIFSIILIAVVISSCAGKRKIKEESNQPVVAVQDTSKTAEKKPLHLFKYKSFDYKWFTSRINADVTLGSDHYNASLYLVVAKDSVLYLSCNKLGLELGRLVCTPDSVKVMIHLNSSYWKGTYSDLYTESGLYLQYDLIQALFTNNDFSSFSRNFQWFKEEDGCQVWVDNSRKPKLASVELSDQLTLDSNGRIFNHFLRQKSYYLMAKYRNMSIVENSVERFPIDITVSMPKIAFVLQMQYKVPKINVKGPTAFKLPSKYTRLQIPKML